MAGAAAAAGGHRGPAGADAEQSEGLAKSPTPKSLLKKSRAIPGRADLRTFGRRASATDGALRVGGHVGL